MPADEEDSRQHAESLLYEYKRRLKIRERQKARLGDAADPSVDLEIAQLRTNIAMLEPVVEPEPAEEVKEAVRRHIADDYLFVFRQVVKVGERLIRREEYDATTADEIQQIKTEVQQIKAVVESEQAGRPKRQEEVDQRFDKQDEVLKVIRKWLIGIIIVVGFLVFFRLSDILHVIDGWLR